MANKQWIQDAIKNKGSFSKKAKKAGKTTAQYAKEVTTKSSKASTKTKKQAVLAETLAKLRKRKK